MLVSKELHALAEKPLDDRYEMSMGILRAYCERLGSIYSTKPYIYENNI